MKKALKGLLTVTMHIMRYLIVSNIFVYVGTRMINFFKDPFMEDVKVTYFKDYLDVHFANAIMWIIMFNVCETTYKLFIKRENTTRNWLVFGVNMSIILIGIFG